MIHYGRRGFDNRCCCMFVLIYNTALSVNCVHTIFTLFVGSFTFFVVDLSVILLRQQVVLYMQFVIFCYLVLSVRTALETLFCLSVGLSWMCIGYCNGIKKILLKWRAYTGFG